MVYVLYAVIFFGFVFMFLDIGDLILSHFFKDIKIFNENIDVAYRLKLLALKIFIWFAAIWMVIETIRTHFFEQSKFEDMLLEMLLHGKSL